MQSDDLNKDIRSEAIREAVGLQMTKGLDFESFLVGIHISLSDSTLGKWIAEAFDKDEDSAARLRGMGDQLAARMRETLENPSAHSSDQSN